MSKSTLYRLVAATLIAALLAEVFIPATAMALTSGPVQPEFSSFEPVATTSMVNEFTGAFNYNLPVISIPGPNGMGYALSLSYHNATSVEEEASWVGLGWTLNPGSIGRMKRGFPDEYKGAEVEYWNKVRDNWTASVTKKVDGEVWSWDLGVGAFTTQRYNNYSGYGYVNGLSLGVVGLASVSFTESAGKSSWGFTINPSSKLSTLRKYRENKGSGKGMTEASWGKQLEKNAKDMVAKSFNNPTAQDVTGIFGLSSFNDYTLPVNTEAYNGEEWLAEIAVQTDAIANIGLKGGIAGSYTIQKNVPKVVRGAYGYMYSGIAEGLAEGGEQYKKAIMDYYVEKDAPYNKRDYFLGIPFSNADNFHVSGEGLGGSFRLHQRRPGHFRPAYAESHTNIYHIDLTLHVGTDIGLGADLGYGDHDLTVDQWKTAVVKKEDEEENEIPHRFSASTDDEPYFYRFADDLGGTVEYAGDDAPASAYQPSLLDAIAIGSLSMQGKIWPGTNQGSRSGRAAYIGFNTNSGINYHPPMHCWDGAVNETVDLRGYAREGLPNPNTSEPEPNEERISRFVKRSTVGDDVGEFGITKEDGSVYVYGLPVYSREEAELQFGVQGISASQIDDNFLVFKHGVPSENVDYPVVGEIRKTPYPSMYLLTEILSPDYVDRTMNGPTPDDLGGYVKFDYERTAGTTDKKDAALGDWFRWRTPYKGLHYQRNSLSDFYDDVGTVQSGYKEIYYLASIETRTHIALFQTSPRRDGYPAELSEAAASGEATANRSTSAADDTDNQKLRKLDRIRLHAKDGNGELSTLLTTVNFEYRYSLCEGLPNSEMDGTERLGKLTLKRVWFEHEGVFGAKISPYEFGYEYRPGTSYPSSIQSRYGDPNDPDDIMDFGANWDDANWQDDENDIQNPDYSSFDIDRWGNYQYDGRARHDRLIPWVKQFSEPANFDPAAWQLKWIKLPSGGEIHVQYEQNDYRYVQHRPVMAMVRLTGGNATDGFDLNLADLGLTSPENDAEIEQLVTEIRKLYQEDREYIYFKFLYALEGNNTGFDQCSSEFITGYANVPSGSPAVVKDGGTIRIKIGGGADYTLPDEVCKDFVYTSRAGVIRKAAPCDPSQMGIPQSKEVDVDVVAKTLWGLFWDFGRDYVDDANTCLTIDYENSYLRIPMTGAKLGGGVRVKRLLMYDRGMDESNEEDIALYGSEYIYKTVDGESSGVATNEPVIGREENPLVGLVKKRANDINIEAIVSGNSIGFTFTEDKREQFEGPLGESIMPGASVGYSRVVVKNIYQGKTGTGHAVSEFFTAKDYPFDLRFSSPAKENANVVQGLKSDWTKLEGPTKRDFSFSVGVASYSIASIWRVQGFRFVLNAMHGKPKSITKYSGDDDDPNASVVEQVTYDYFEPGEPIPVMSGPGTENITMKPLGKEMEVVFSTRTVEDIAHDYGIEGDYGLFLGFLFPFPFGSVQGSFRRTESILKSHVTTKVIHYPAIQKRVTVTKDGITDVTENIGFDAKSGKAVLTRNYDGYHGVATGTTPTVRDGSYYAVTLPAWRYYPLMGQIADRQGLQLGGPSSVLSVDKRYDGSKHYLVVNIKAKTDQPTPLQLLATGDLVEIKGTTVERLGVYRVGTIAGNRIELLPTSYSLVYDYPLRSDVLVEILRAGNTNQLTTNAGSFTTYGAEP